MDKNILIKIEQNLKRIADSLERNKSESFNSKFNDKSNAFVWDADKNILRSLKKINAIELKLLQGIEHQTNTLYENTVNFSKGFLANNALLWGARGNGKSTLIKSVFNHVLNNHKNLKLIQINKNNILDIQFIYNLIGKIEESRFILFIDDLSFEKIDSDYKIIKSTLDGSVQNQPTNILLYVSSNRRHLMPRDMIDNERSSAIHTDENVEEKISLSDRFGLWLGFHKLSQNDYIKIIEAYCIYYNISFNDKIKKESIQWSLQRGNRTGRTAWQFILNIASKNNLKIKF